MSDRDYWRDTEGRPSGFWATIPVTKALLIGLAGIHFVMALLARADPRAYDDVLRAFALSPQGVLDDLRVWQLVTCALLHFDLMHLLFNLLGIWIFGRLVEERLGTRRYLAFALGTVLAASLGFLLWARIEHERWPMMGISGLDFGLIVLCAFWYPRLPMLFLFVLPVPLWAGALLFVAIELFLLLEMPGGIAHSAHLGGALYGLLYYRFGGGIDRVFSGFDAWQARRRRRRMEQERRDAEDLRGEVDRILDKVNREGMTALTDKERRVLREASQRLRR